MRKLVLMMSFVLATGITGTGMAQSDQAIGDIVTKQDLIKLDRSDNQKINHNLTRRDDTIYLTPKESKMLDLDQAVGSVIVANPAHASVFMDTPQKIVIMPGQPGATDFTLLNQAGDEILTRTIVVTERDTPLIRVRQICNGDDCVGDTVYYCPDICHAVAPTGGGEDGEGGIGGGGGAPSAPGGEEGGF